jgi:hypothetical protein
VHFAHVVTSRLVGETISLRLRRGGQETTRDVRLLGLKRLVPGPQYDVAPTYLIFAGLVFQPLDGSLVERLGPWSPGLGTWTTLNNVVTESHRQVVVLAQVLSHPINQGYDELGGAVVLRVNDQPLGDMRSLAAVIDAAGDGWVRFGLDTGEVLLTHATRARAVEKEILSAYDIPAARSPDLAGARPAQ